MKTIFKKAAIAVAIQTILVAPNAYAEEATEEQDDGTLETIIVTAQKREQSAQEVPIAVSTLYGDEFDAMFAGGEDILTLANRIPGLYAESSNGRVAPRFYIRGLGNTDFDLAASQPVSVIMDDVVMENVVLKSFPLFDMEGVEVIKGPQGTLFGRNTTAGIVKLTSKRPTEEFEGYLSLSYGERGTQIVEGAVSGSLSEDLSARVSVLSNHRDNWISNGFTGEEDVMGGFEDNAIRLQFSYQPNDDLDILFSYQNRDLSGTATLFRANVLTTGSNRLNENFIRNTVFFDEGDNNPQNYEGDGAVLTIDYDLGDMTFTAITAKHTAKGASLGDIDGGFGASFLPFMGPGFIPFPSVTQDEADVSQLTQEFRLASDTDGDYTWQVGYFYFESDLEVVTSPFFIPSSTVYQGNETWAGFGQLTYDVSDDTTLVAGMRYTKDEKDLQAISGAGIPIDPVELDDSHVSWEAMINHMWNEDTSIYGRIASGFRAQSIQGRDIAFFGTPSIADSETILSYEVGFKSDMLDNTLRLNGALFAYDVDDIQLTKVGGNGNNIGLDNANTGTALGYELDATYRLNQYVTLTLAYTATDTEIKDGALLIPTCGSGQCTPTDPLDGSGNAFVNGNPFPQSPENVIIATGRFTVPLDSGEVYAFVDLARQGNTNLFIYESVEYNLGSQFEAGVRIGYINNEHDYEVAAFARNVTDEENIKGGIDFNNNTAFVNEPRIIGVEFRKNFN